MQTLETCGECTYFFPNRTWQEESAHPHAAYRYPPVKSKFAATSIISYSMNYNMSVIVTTDGTGYMIGYNLFNIKIGSTIPYTLFDYTKIEIRSPSNQPCQFISAVCCQGFSVFLVTDGVQNYLAIQKVDEKTTKPVFVDTLGYKPIALYNGHYFFAAIDSEGGILIINVGNGMSPIQPTKRSILPNNQKAIMVCFSRGHIIAISSTNHLYSTEYRKTEFFEVPEFKNIEINWISGFSWFSLLVTKDHRVFFHGDSSYAPFMVETNGVDPCKNFVQMHDFDGLGIDKAFVGTCHSLFINYEGKLYGLGCNSHGYLLLASGPCDTIFGKPVETSVNDAAFVALDSHATALFRNYIPPKSPNNKIILDTIISAAPIPSEFNSNVSLLKE